MIGGFGYFLAVLPAVFLMMWAQYRVKSAFRNGMQVPARTSGAAAARHILDSAGLEHVAIERVGGTLSDHYDPGKKVLRLSEAVYHEQTAASVGIAAHEAGHALQDAQRYAPLVLRNIAVPAAQYGPMSSMAFLVLGGLLQMPILIWLGIIAFSGILIFQVINLPVEFDASHRAKALLNETGIVDEQGAVAVRKVLNAAAWTYVAATLQSLLTLLYYISVFTGRRR